MAKSMNLKKRRLLEAFGDNQEYDQDSKRQLNPKTGCVTFEMRIQMLEQWEISKRRAMESLAIEIEELKKKEDEIEVKQQALATRGLKIDEQVLDRYSSNSESEKSLTSPPILDNPPIRRKNPTKILAHSTPKVSITNVNKSNLAEMVSIGPNGTMISKDAIESINWSSPAVATRRLLMEVFDRETLAFHTLTGKPSPAFMDCDKPLKNKLDPVKVEDIINYITKNSNVSAKDVRSTITTKCADENKMYRQREKKQKALKKTNKENILIFLN